MSRYSLSRKYTTSAGRREPRGHRSQVDWTRREKTFQPQTSVTLQRLEAALANLGTSNKAS